MQEAVARVGDLSGHGLRSGVTGPVAHFGFKAKRSQVPVNLTHVEQPVF